MGLMTNAAAFAGGYLLGAKNGLDPLKRAGDRVRSSATTRAQAMLHSPGGTTDVRDVREVMTAAPQTLAVGAPSVEAARIMRDTDVGDVLVTEGESLVGIVTDRDIVVRAVSEMRDAAATSVGDIMSTDVLSVAPTTSVRDAMKLMRDHDVRRIPVVESGRAIGIVSLGDVSLDPGAADVLADVSTAPPNG